MKEEINKTELPKDDLQLRAWCIEKVMRRDLTFYPRDKYLDWVKEKAQELFDWCKRK